jgi:hypothetical protein
MVLFNYSTKELTAKVVYYGPGLCGKTTNLQWIHEQLPIKNKGKMLSLATEADRTLFFDFLPIELGTIRGMKTRVQLYTVPGQVFYNATRRMVLKGADCVVFVADSQDAMMDANTDAMRNLRENLIANELDADNIPLVIQYNKRDLPNAAPIPDLNRVLNTRGVPFVEASAKNGQGVEETLKVATQLVFRVLASKYGNEGMNTGSGGRTTGGLHRPAFAGKPAQPPPLSPPAPPPFAAATRLPPPTRVAPAAPPSLSPQPAPANLPSLSATDDLLDSLGGPGPAPRLSLDSELGLGPAPDAVDLGDPLEALSGPAAESSPNVDPFGPGLSLDSSEGSPSPEPSAAAGEELDLDLGPPPGPGDPGDPFGSPLDSAFSPAPSSSEPEPLGDPFGSSPEASAFDSPEPGPRAASSAPPPDSMAELGALGSSSSFTSDPVNVEASVDLDASSLKADPVHVSVPIELDLSAGGRNILIPIRLQLKIRIR